MEWIRKWWGILAFCFGVVCTGIGMYIQHRIELNQIQNDLNDLKEDNQKMPKRVLSELKAWMFEKEMKLRGVKRRNDTIIINR